MHNLDLAVSKIFPVSESFNVRFRAEVFNVFNRAQFGILNPLSRRSRVWPVC